MNSSTHTIDARGRGIGRVATEAARILRGKHLTSYNPREVPVVKVVVTNAQHLLIRPAQKKQIFTTYSGYPGGKREHIIANVIRSKGNSAILERAISGMIPRNKLKKEVLKNLTIKES